LRQAQDDVDRQWFVYKNRAAMPGREHPLVEEPVAPEEDAGAPVKGEDGE
jgi:hypothetical protein